MKKILKNIVTIIGPLIGGTLISLFTGSKAYKVINKPILSPPGWIFPVMWSILYILMGISLYMVLKENNNAKSKRLFIAQLVVNYIWPILFFKFKLYTVAAIWLLLLIYLVITMIDDFSSIKKLAGRLQVPYFIWLLFALYLNIGVALLN